MATFKDVEVTEQAMVKEDTDTGEDDSDDEIALNPMDDSLIKFQMRFYE